MKQMKKLTLWFAMALTLILMAGMGVCAESEVKTPTGVYQDGANSTGIRVKFVDAANCGPSNYEVQISTDKMNWQTVQADINSSFQATVKNLSTGRSYFVRLRARRQSTGEVSDWTQPYKVSTAPGNVSSPVTQTGAVTATAGTISWGPAVGATGYDIYCTSSLTENPTCIGTTTSTSYTLKNLSKDTAYIVTVMPYTDLNVGTVNQGYVYTAGISNALTSGNSYLVRTLPEKVKNLYNFEWKANSKKITVAWQEGNVADGYELVFYNDKNKKVKTANVSFGTKAYNTYQCSKVKKNSFCKVKIRAYVTVGGKKFYSEYTKPIYCISDPKMTKGRQDNGYLSINWKKVNGATGYDIYIGRSNTKSAYKKVASVGKNKTSYVATKFKGSKITRYGKYYFYVVAKKKVKGKTYKSSVSSVYSYRK